MYLLIGTTIILALFIAGYLITGNKKAVVFTKRVISHLHEQPDVLFPHKSRQDKVSFMKEVVAIQTLYNLQNEAWCKGDGNLYASVFTQDVDYISYDGMHAIGRSSLAESHRLLFSTFLKNTCLKGYIKRIKFLSEDAALVYIESGTSFGTSKLIRRPSIQTCVAVKQENTWVFTTFHNSRIDPIEGWSIVRKMWLGINTVVFRR